MLKKIAPLISPELIKILMEMGHTDEIVICDGNMLPARSENVLSVWMATTFLRFSKRP